MKVKNIGYMFAKSIMESKSFRKRKYWKADVLRKMLEEHYRGEKNHSQELWKVIILELWLRRRIDENS